MDVRDEVIDKMKGLLATILGADPTKITEETTFEADLGAKSTNITTMLTQLEDDYDVEIPFLQVKRAKTVGATADLIASKLDE